MRHPEAELVAFVRGELAGAARDRVAQHLAACADCRRFGDDARGALEALRSQTPEPPAVHWPGYRMEIHRKLEERSVRRGWWRWPVPLALSAGLAGVLVFLALQGGERVGGRPGGGSVETAIAPRLDLFRNYRVMERLDLLEDFDILRGLEDPTGRREG
jgi:hypothetical protein